LFFVVKEAGKNNQNISSSLYSFIFHTAKIAKWGKINLMIYYGI